MTGEEDEEVVLEQKGVKLYTKRGDKPFSEGVVGHMKLLSNRTTHEERIRESFFPAIYTELEYNLLP